MSTENIEVQEQSVAAAEIDYKARCAELESKLEAESRTKQALLTEKKKLAAEKEEQSIHAQKLAQEKAIKDGEYEKLWKSADEVAKAHEERYTSLLNEIKQEKIQAQAMKLAVELADGNASSAKLLSKFVQESINKISNERGEVDESVLTSVKREFENNKDYAPLLGGSKASGGGALGNGSSATKTTRTVSREQFDTMSISQQRDFIVNQKGKVTNDA